MLDKSNEQHLCQLNLSRCKRVDKSDKQWKMADLSNQGKDHLQGRVPTGHLARRLLIFWSTLCYEVLWRLQNASGFLLQNTTVVTMLQYVTILLQNAAFTTKCSRKNLFCWKPAPLVCIDWFSIIQVLEFSLIFWYISENSLIGLRNSIFNSAAVLLPMLTNTFN